MGFSSLLINNPFRVTYVMPHFFHFSTVGKQEFIDNNQLWQRMLDDDKLASEGYHELMIKFNIQFIKQ